MIRQPFLWIAAIVMGFVASGSAHAQRGGIGLSIGTGNSGYRGGTVPFWGNGAYDPLPGRGYHPNFGTPFPPAWSPTFRNSPGYFYGVYPGQYRSPIDPSVYSFQRPLYRNTPDLPAYSFPQRYSGSVAPYRLPSEAPSRSGSILDPYPPPTLPLTSPVDGKLPVRVTVTVPAEDADVRLDGHATRQTGLSREFVSPALEPGHDYSYTVTARWTHDGKEVERSKTVTVRPGERVNVTFTSP